MTVDSLTVYLDAIEQSDYSIIPGEIRERAAAFANRGNSEYATICIEQAINRQTEVLSRIYQILLNRFPF